MIVPYGPPDSILDAQAVVGATLDFDERHMLFLSQAQAAGNPVTVLDDQGFPVICAFDKVTGKLWCRICTVNLQTDANAATIKALGAIQAANQPNPKLDGYWVPVVTAVIPVAGAPLKINATGAVHSAMVLGTSTAGTLAAASADAAGGTGEDIGGLL